MNKSSFIVPALFFGVTTVACNSSDTAVTSDGGGPAPLPIGCAAESMDASPHQPVIDPTNFVTNVTNKYFPLVPGTTSTITDPDGNYADFQVTSQTKVIMGVTNIVVYDVVKTKDGEMVEETYDWFAHDKDGNVWYFGEDTKEYQGGKVVSTHGSWEAGKDCGIPGVIMWGAPTVGKKYWEEYYKNEAEDEAEVLSITEHVEVPYNASGAAGPGMYDNCVRTKNWTRLDQNLVEEKWYCDGIGLAKAVDVSSVAPKTEVLTKITKM